MYNMDLTDPYTNLIQLPSRMQAADLRTQQFD